MFCYLFLCFVCGGYHAFPLSSSPSPSFWASPFKVTSQVPFFTSPVWKTPSPYSWCSSYRLSSLMCLCPSVLKDGRTFPCGQCINCKVNRKRKWIARSLLESTQHRASMFLTLTYEVPRSDVAGMYETYLNKQQLKNFFKRLRSKYRDVNFKYFAVGEYGTKQGRAHYHVLLFSGSCFLDKPSISCLWTLGGVDCGDIEHASIDYVVSYCVQESKVFRDVYSSVETRQARPPFRLISNGYGLGALQNLAVNGVLVREFRVLGKCWPIDRYLQQKHLGGKTKSEYWDSHGGLPLQPSQQEWLEKSLYEELRHLPYGTEDYQKALEHIAQVKKEKTERLVKLNQIAHYRSINQPLKGKKHETF